MSDADTTTLADPLEAMPAPERVNYATGVLLAAEDFRDEQTYQQDTIQGLHDRILSQTEELRAESESRMQLGLARRRVE